MTLNISERNINVKNSGRKVRRMGRVPGVLYGEQINNFMFEISELDLNKEIASMGEHGIVSVSYNGTENKALIKEVQREPVNHKIVHIDLERIHPDKIIQSEVPVIFNNEKVVAQIGGILQKEKSSVNIQCKASELPKQLNVDLGKRKRGNVFRIADIELAEEIMILDDRNTVLAAITNGNTNDITLENEAEAPVQEIQKD